MKIAISGKGGSGKTTMAGVLARSLARMGYKVLAIDVDPNPNLALTLGIPKEEGAGITPLGEGADPFRSYTFDEIVEAYGLKAPGDVILLVAGKVDHSGTG